ncbi:phosphate ABC transporter permease subunit PstC [uncultured Pseudokineococcus sp.]|uniref:phosphate ABC transporter permease subunit PstC n=1 Tax=uncultured Pseudokineococcus sp. TaxID=1642928 RepID=UPI0026154F7B|nr:phosphate ABC transporter permease subunit PstC [uncultured Pseudokineococcus sp.]
MTTTTPALTGSRRRPGDKVFSGSAAASAVLILVILAGVGLFLLAEAYPALVAPADQIEGGEGLVVYLWPILFGTVLTSVIAMLVAVPVAVGIALFISHYAPRRLSQTLGYVVDLLAAVPSIVYGFWGFQVFALALVPLYQWLAENVGWIPLFAGPASTTGKTILTASLVLAVMILPIISALSREVFLQTPRLHEEAALALGATRWEMIKYAVIPYGRSGVISASMLGLGRALGETMAVTLVLSASTSAITFNLINTANPPTIAAEIALNFPEATGLRLSTLIAAGLVLFVLTFAVNFAARALVTRQKGGST